MELKELSGNWKNLQETLQRDKSTKRKASPRTITQPQTAKRLRPSTNGRAGADAKLKWKMGFGMSSLSADQNAAAEPLVTTDIQDEPMTRAITDGSTDVINAGLSPNVNVGKFIAIDCEMVGIGPQPDTTCALARVSVVDFHGVQLYDSFVLPRERVTDYRTHVSGITPRLLRQARSFDEVQQEVAKLLKGRILIGHHLRHDLEALLLGHPRQDIRDTSRYPPYRAIAGGRTPALRRLAMDILGVEIQSAEHSSLEDARAAMALFRREKEGFEQEHAKRWGKIDKTSRSRQAEKEDVDMVKNRAKKVGGRKKKKRKNGKN